MKLPKLKEGEHNDVIDALKSISDQDVLDYLEQKVIFGGIDWESKCLAKLYALLYKYDNQLNDYENSLNDMTERAEKLEQTGKIFLKSIYSQFGQNIELQVEALEFEKVLYISSVQN